MPHDLFDRFEWIPLDDFLKDPILPAPAPDPPLPSDSVSFVEFVKMIKDLTVCSWNSQGLCAKKPDRYRVKVNFLKQLLAKNLVVGVQETHDDEVILKKLSSLDGFSEFRLFNSPDTHFFW